MPAAADLWLKDPAYRGLLDDVIENPDDDTPRLVMADWLEEHGDQIARDRARFIRLQLARAKVSEHSPQAWASRHEESRLVNAHRGEWLGRLEKITSRVTFDRGFPDDVVVGVAMFAKNADTLFTLTPVRRLQILRIAQTKLAMADLAVIDGLKRLRGLCLRNSGLGDIRVASFLETVQLPHLEELDLSGSGCGEHTLGVLAKRRLPRFTSLNLAGTTFFGPFSLIQRALSDYRLTALDLSGITFERPDFEQMAAWPGLAALRRLELNDVSLGAGGASLLFASPHLGELTRLGLNMASIRQGGAAALAGCERLAGLRSLDVSNCMLDDQAVRNLLDGPHLKGLEHLDLGGNGLYIPTMQTLAAWPGLASLRSLRLAFNPLTNAGLQALLESPNLGPLTTLDLFNCSLTPGLGPLLASCAKLSSLVKLDLSYNAFGPADAEALLDSPLLTALRHIKGKPGRLPQPLLDRWRERFPETE